MSRSNALTKCLTLAAATTLLTAAAACAGGATQAAPSPVQGVVVDADGEPAAGVSVRVTSDDRLSLVTTDGDGRFAAPAVADTYDVAVARGDRAYVFQGMQSRTPRIALFDQVLSLRSHEGEVRLALPGDLPAGARIVVAARAPVVDVDARPDEKDAATIDVHVRWLGGPTERAELLAIAYEADDRTLAPSRYLGVARAPLSLEHRGVTPWAPVFGRVETDHVAARVAAPRDHALAWSSLYLDEGAAPIKLADRVDASPDVDFLVPRLDDARFTIESVATAPHADLGERLASGVSAPGGAIDLAAAPALAAPVAGARVSRDTTFAWRPLDGHASWVYFGPADAAAPGPRLWVATGDRATGLPDLDQLGVTLPHGVPLAWYVVAARGGGVEDAAERGLFDRSAGVSGNSATRAFTIE